MASGFPYAERAKAVEAARQAVHASHRTLQQDRSDAARRAWTDSVATFHACLGRAYHPLFWDSLATLRSGSGGSADIVIEFLEADPFFFRSGYGKVLRALKRAALTRRQVSRLQDALARALEQPAKREFGNPCRLAPFVADDGFRGRVAVLADSVDAGVARRARRMLAALRVPPGTGGAKFAAHAAR